MTLEERVRDVRRSVEALATHADDRDIPWAAAGAQELQATIAKWFPTLGMEPLEQFTPSDTFVKPPTEEKYRIVVYGAGGPKDE